MTTFFSGTLFRLTSDQAFGGAPPYRLEKKADYSNITDRIELSLAKSKNCHHFITLYPHPSLSDGEQGDAIFRMDGTEAKDVFLLKDLPIPLPSGWNVAPPIENNDHDQQGGFKIISVFFMIALKSGDLVDGYFRGIKLKYLCFGTTKLSSLFDNLKSLVGVQGVMQESYAKSVSFDAIAPDQDPSAIKEQGKYFMDVVKLPWMKPGVGFVNQGSSLDRNKTIDENKLTSEGVIYCEAYQPGNGLTSYPKGDPGLLGGINWFDAVLDIVTSLAGSKSGTSTGR